MLFELNKIKTEQYKISKYENKKVNTSIQLQCLLLDKSLEKGTVGSLNRPFQC